MKQATYTAASSSPTDPATHEPEPEDEASESFDWIGWLKYFTFYLGAVVVVGLIGFYFLWKIPFVQDPAQLLRIVDDNRSSRPLMPAPSPPIQPILPVQSAPSPPPVDVATVPTPPETVPVETPPATPTDLAGAPSPPDVSSAPPTTPAEPPAEVVPPPPAEIEQLLTDAQQQMDNRRFTAPASGNALSTYRHVLELQPDHPGALDGIQRIATYYRDVAQKSLQQGKLDESLAYISRGLRASPKSDGLLNLRKQVQQAKKREQDAQRQAALEEARRQQRQPLQPSQQEQPLGQPDAQPASRLPANSGDNSGFNQR